MRIRPPANRSRRRPGVVRGGRRPRRICLLTASPPDRNLVLTPNPARQWLTPALSSTCNFSEYTSESACRSERFRSFAVNVAGALRSTTNSLAPRRRLPFRGRHCPTRGAAGGASARRRRLGLAARLGSIALADRPDRRRRPRPVDVERQMGGVLRFLAGGVRLDRIEAQCPLLGDEIDEPFQSSAHAAAGQRATLDPSAAVVEAQRDGELVERRSAEAHVAPDVDRPALAAAQRLLEVDADDAAVRRL